MTITGDVDVPKVGKVDKKVVAAVVVSAAGFVGYRRWQASRIGSTADTAGTTVASEFDDSGDPSAVLGAVSPTNAYGSGSATPAEPASTDDFGFHGKTNDAWTQYAAAQLSQSDRWNYTDIVEALGKYLAQQPTTSEQQSIVNAAVAVAGHPPIGSFTLIHTAEPIAPITPVTPPVVVATPAAAPGTPTGVRLTSNTTAQFTIAWNPVAGATTYVVDTHNGQLHPTSATSFSFKVFRHKNKYKVTVRAVGPTGLTSGDSAAVSFTSK